MAKTSNSNSSSNSSPNSSLNSSRNSNDIIFSGARSLSRDAFELETRKIAYLLKDRGLGRGDIIALIMRNDFAYFTLAEAVRFVGAQITPVNWHLTANEMAYILKDCSAKMIVAHADLLDPDLAAEFSHVDIFVEPVPQEIAAAYKSRSHSFTYPSLSETISTLEPFSGEIGPPAPAVFYTSGTTGQPKAVERKPIAPEIGQAIAKRSAQAFGLTDADMCVIMTGPLYHSAPNAYALYALRNGARIILQPRFDAEEFLRLTEQYAVTHAHMVPIMFQRLLALPHEIVKKYDHSSLRHIVHGAAPCPVSVKAAIIDMLGNVINEYYAMTELGIITCSTSAQWLEAPGTVGAPPPGVKIEIRDDENGLCPANIAGTIWVQHEATHAFSYRNDEAKAEAMRRDGFVNTGDVGYLNERNYLFISDRKTDMVISGGVNIYPAEIEAALATIPHVRDSAVFGVPDEEFGEALVAYIEADTALDRAELTSVLQTKIAKFKIPRHFAFLPQLPREDSGKIKKRHLKAEFLSDQEMRTR